MLHKTNSEKITWEFSKPSSFPCSLCYEKEATYRNTYKNDDVTVKLVVCDRCRDMSPLLLETIIR
jgi:hypothetical protein